MESKTLVELVSEIEKKPGGKRGKVTLYMSTDVFKEFKSLCDGVSASRVIEKFISEYISEKKAG